MDDFFAEEEKLFAEEDVFRDEVKAFERAGLTGKLSELLSSTKTIGKKGREIISPEDRFLINTDAFCRRINSQNIAKVTENDINIILTKTTDIPNLKFKNHIAYVLGYIASQGGQNLKQVKNVIKNVLPELEGEGGVEPADVLRYSRFWTLYLYK